MPGETERPWVRIVASAIGGASVVLAALLPLYFSRQNSLGSEIAGLRQEIRQLQAALAQKEAEIPSTNERRAPPSKSKDTPAPDFAQPAPPDERPLVIAQHEVRAAPSQLTFRALDIIFQLKGCQVAESVLNCELLITNKGVDRSFWLRGSRLVDESGVEYSTSKLSIGSQGAGSFSLPNEVPIKARIEFENVPAQLKRIRFLQVSCGAMGSMLWDFFNARFDNVDVQ
jgi:hypothetical protein